MLNLQSILLKDNSGIFFYPNLLNLYIYIISEARFENDGVTLFKKKKKRCMNIFVVSYFGKCMKRLVPLSSISVKFRATAG